MPSKHLRSYTFGLGKAVAFLAAWLATFTALYLFSTQIHRFADQNTATYGLRLAGLLRKATVLSIKYMPLKLTLISA